MPEARALESKFGLAADSVLKSKFNRSAVPPTPMTTTRTTATTATTTTIDDEFGAENFTKILNRVGAIDFVQNY